VFFSLRDGDMKTRVFQVDLTPTPGVPVQISDEAHDALLLPLLAAGAP
jgi:hypothetical protein